MNINFSAKLFELDGTEIKRDTPDGPAEWTIGQASANALVGGPRQAPSSDPMGDYHLAQRIYAGGDVEISVEEAALVKAAVKLSYNPLIAGQILQAIEAAGKS